MNRIKSYTFASVLTAGLVLGSCASPLTKKLYFTSSRPRAYLPTDKEERHQDSGHRSGDGDGGASTREDFYPA